METLQSRQLFEQLPAPSSACLTSGSEETVRGLSEAAWRADVRRTAIEPHVIGNVLRALGYRSATADRRDLALGLDDLSREGMARLRGNRRGFYIAVGYGVAAR